MRLQLCPGFPQAFRVFILTGLLAIAPTSAQRALGAADQPPVDVPKLSAAIEKSERSLLNLYVRASAKNQKWDPATKTWKGAGENQSVAWYEGVPKGKAKVRVERELIPWKTGAKAFTDAQYIVAFDGQRGLELNTVIGTAANPSHELEGQITSDRPIRLELASELKTGWEFSLYGVFHDGGFRFSGLVDQSPPPPGAPQVKPKSFRVVKLGGLQCVEIVAFTPTGEGDRYDLDPARAYALVRHEHFINDGRVVIRVTVNSLIEAAPGVFYPEDALWEFMWNHDGTPGDPYQQEHFIASDAVANDPAFSDDRFKIEWPVHTHIQDKITGREYTVSEADAPAR